MSLKIFASFLMYYRVILSLSKLRGLRNHRSFLLIELCGLLKYIENTVNCVILHIESPVFFLLEFLKSLVMDFHQGLDIVYNNEDLIGLDREIVEDFLQDLAPG